MTRINDKRNNRRNRQRNNNAELNPFAQMPLGEILEKGAEMIIKALMQMVITLFCCCADDYVCCCACRFYVSYQL